MIAHPFSLRQLQYALAVAETRSFHKAAERCHVSQPSLSAQIAQLEDVLGVRLFERDHRRVLVTSVGHDLLEQALRVIVESNDLLEEAKRLQDPMAGTIRIGVIPTISPYLLPSLTSALGQRFSRLQVMWVEDKTEALLRSLGAGMLEAALVALEAGIGKLEREIIAIDPFVLATPAGHPLGSRSSPAERRELDREKILLLDDGHCFRKQALEYCATTDAHELAFRATSLSTLAQMVAGGAGVTLLPMLSLPTECQRASLCIRPFEEPAPYRTIGLVWRQSQYLAPAIRNLSAAMRDAYPTRALSTKGTENRV